MVEVNSSNLNDQEEASISKGGNGKTRPSFCTLILDAEKLRTILENIPSGVVVIEKPDGKITYANNRAIELHGVNPCGLEIKDHASKLKIKKLDGKLCRSEDLYTYRALFNEETLRNSTIMIQQPSGKQYIVVVSARPLHDRDGKVNAAVAVFEDVTGHVKTQDALADSEERLKVAQRIAHLGSWEYYVKEDKAVWSEELFNIFGLKPQQYGPNVVEYAKLIYPEDREAINKSMEKLLFNPELPAKTSFDYRIIRADGAIRTLHSERMIREIGIDKKPIRIVGIEQDITERKQIEQKLEQYAKNLEELVDERTKQLKDAERFAAIGQTAGMIGHDIRNPLQAIAGELFLMKQEIADSPYTECKRGVQEGLNMVEQQVDYINRIVLDLQDYARPLKPEFSEVDLCTAIPNLLATVEVPKNIRTVGECDRNLPKMSLDLTFLKRILVNLATNAVQAMPQGGTLTVEAFKENNEVLITVSDTGVGIPDELKPKLFQPLMTTKSKGQGFGLAVVKRLVEAQGGKISVESRVGKGTKFRIVFPNEEPGSYQI